MSKAGSSKMSQDNFSLESDARTPEGNIESSTTLKEVETKMPDLIQDTGDSTEKSLGANTDKIDPMSPRQSEHSKQSFKNTSQRTSKDDENQSASRSTANSSDHAVNKGSHGSDCGSSGCVYGQERLETFKPKVLQLLQDIGYGEPSQLERMEGGGYNRIIGLTFPSLPNKDYVLRIPRHCPVEGDEESDNTKDQVSVLQYLSRFSFLPLPTIAAWDASAKNAIASPYVLQKRLPGQSAEELFGDMSQSQRLEVAKAVAEMLIKMESIVLEKPGILRAAPEFPCVAHTVPNSLHDIEIKGFKSDGKVCGLLPSLEKQPLLEFFTTAFDHRLHHDRVYEWHVEWYKKLKVIASQMQKAGLIRNSDTDCVIWHWDFSANNIMIRQRDKHSKASTKTCEHNVQFSVGAQSDNGHRHTVQLKINDDSGPDCKHKVQVTIEGASGETYCHTLQIIGKDSGDDSVHKSISTKPAEFSENNNKDEHSCYKQANTGAEWEITGVIDWDEALSVPKVLARVPPYWLWCKSDDIEWWEEDRGQYNEGLCQNSLFAKAQFDNIMAHADPTYLEDAYGRGLWLRRLARFAINGFDEYNAYNRYEKFVKDWKIYYKSLCLPDDYSEVEDSEDDVDSDNDEDSAIAHGSEEDTDTDSKISEDDEDAQKKPGENESEANSKDEGEESSDGNNGET